MLAFYCEGEDVKKFMGLLLTGHTFDRMQLRTAEVVTRVSFTVDGRFNKEFDGVETERAYCLWGEVRQNMFDLIKGKHLPKTLKLVLALDDEAVEALHKNARAAFLNISFENGKVTFTTGTAQREFAMDKSLDAAWEDKVRLMFTKLGINVKPLN
jgi:hypothetical protein